MVQLWPVYSNHIAELASLPNIVCVCPKQAKCALITVPKTYLWPKALIEHCIVLLGLLSCRFIDRYEQFL